MKYALAFTAGMAAVALASPANALDLSALPDASAMPEGVLQLSPVVPGMGEHWANPADLPLGPIYCVFEGKILCLEFMMAQEAFAAGQSWPDLRGVEGLPPVNHIKMKFEPQGHQGYEIPHYDMHLYFLSPDDMAEVR